MKRNQLYNELTIIITTSPIKSHPSTELLDDTIGAFKLVDGLDDCDKIIMCDGYNIVEDGKVAFKKAKVTAETIVNYTKFKDTIQKKALCNMYKYTTINEQNARNGFAKNIKIALDLVKTPYVMIVQHDQLFARNVDIHSIINSMKLNSDINYVGMISNSDNDEVSRRLNSKNYEKFMNDIQTEINKDIKFDYHKYNGLSFVYAPLFKENKVDFSLNKDSSKMSITNLILDYHKIKFGLPLMFLVFWYDKTHICRTEFYKKFIFDNIHTNYKTGQSMRVTDFIEDSVGFIEMENIKYNGICSFKNYGSFVLYDNMTSPAITHSDGRKFLTEEETQALIKKSQIVLKNKYLKYKNKYLLLKKSILFEHPLPKKIYL